MIMYHPVKKEIHFLAKVKGEFLEVPYKICPNLIPYSPENGEFLLQNQGNKFFDDIYEQFSNEKISLVFKGTAVDYEDFCEKIAEYNKTTGEERITVSNFIELPSVLEIFNRINDFCEETLQVFDTELKDSDIQQSFQLRRTEFEKKREQLSCSDINLCLVGTYSSGKSTFINTLIGRRILPESTASETLDPTMYGGYTNLQDAVNRIYSLETELEAIKSATLTKDERIAALEAEVTRLSEFETMQVDFQRIRNEFYEEVIYAENGPGPEAYVKYFESYRTMSVRTPT